MLHSKFLRNKIDRQIKQNGQEFVFIRYAKDSYHQKTDEIENEIYIKGIFHTTNAYVQSTVSEGARTVRKPQPMILTLFEAGVLIKVDDEVMISEDTYVVVSKNNINDFNEAYDISLELKT